MGRSPKLHENGGFKRYVLTEGDPRELRTVSNPTLSSLGLRGSSNGDMEGWKEEIAS